MPPKAIPPARDRLQSRILVAIGIPALCYLLFMEFQLLLLVFSGGRGHLSLLDLLRGHYIVWQGRYDGFFVQIVGVSLIFALAAWRMRAATAAAALCGGMICLLLSTNLVATPGTSVVRSGLTPLLLVFILTFEATRICRERKASADLTESRRGRNAGQVIANLGVAAFFSSTVCFYLAERFGWFGEYSGDGQHVATYFVIPYVPMLAALVEATADTVSSEIGQAFGGTPIMLTTFRRVPPGTDGAISLKGSFAGIAAAAVVAASGMPAIGMSATQCAIAFAAGVAGLFFDSLLGATLERRGWIGNDLVNFSSTAFAAAVALLAIRLSQDYLFR